MNLLLSENLPLRTTKVFGVFAESAVLPHHYGDLSNSPVPLIKLSDTKFLVADHPVVKVVKVHIDGADISGYAYSVETDSTGHSYSQVELTTPLPEGSEISASILGKFNPKTGSLMDSAADIVEDIFALAGKDDTCPQLRIETAGLRIAGSLSEVLSIRASIDLVTRSIGAIWTSGMARLYPTDAPTGYDESMVVLDPSNCSMPSFEASLADTSETLQINFDYCEAKKSFQQAITLKASPTPFGGSSTTVSIFEVEAKWIRQPSDAIAMGSRLLTRLASEKVAITFDTSKRGLNPGQWVLLNHPSFPSTVPARMMVLGVSLPPLKGNASITGEALLNTYAVSISVVQVSKAAQSSTSSGIAVTYVNGTATFTVLDPDGKPLMGAMVALDRGQAKKTNSVGKVSFTAKPGKHVLGVQAEGYIPFEMEVTI